MENPTQHSPPAFAPCRLGRCLPGALGLTGLCYVLLQVVAWVWFDVAIEPGAIPLDLFIHLLLGAALYALARGPVWFMAILPVLFSLTHLVNAAKIAMLGGPIMPDDFRAVRSLFLILHGWHSALLVGLSVAAILLLCGMVRLRGQRAWVAAGLLGALTSTLILQPVRVVQTMDSWFGNSVWDQQGNF